MSSEVTLEGLISQLEESKFLRLFRYLLALTPTHGGPASDDQLKRDPIPIDTPDAEFQLKILSRVGSIQSWATAWLFQLVHLPQFLCDEGLLEQELQAHLRRGFESLRARPNPLAAAQELFEAPSYLCATPQGYDYYLYTNVRIDPQGPVAARLSEYGKGCLSELTGGSRHSEHTFGIGSPETVVGVNKSVVQNFVVDLLNSPSSYYLIAREGRISVDVVTEHGSFLANPSGNNQEPSRGISAVTSSSLRSARTNALPELAELEDLINDPKTKEADLQAFLALYPQLLFGLDERYCEVKPHVCLYDSRGERLVPDFMARVQDSDIWDLIELKLPEHRVIVNRAGSERASAAAAKGIAELLRYRDFFGQRANRDRVRDRFGIAPYEPCLVMVIGRGRSTTRYDWSGTPLGLPGVRIVSYDYLFERARACRDGLQAMWDARPRAASGTRSSLVRSNGGQVNRLK